MPLEPLIEPVPDVPLLDALPGVLDEEPVPEPIELELLLGLVGLVVLELEPLGLALLELELPMLPELLLDGVVSVVDDELDEAGGAGGVAVVVLLLELVPLGGGVTTVVRSSLRSHPATPAASASASALVKKILDFMGTPFRLCRGSRHQGRTAPPPAILASADSQVRCHALRPPMRRARPVATGG